MALKEHRNLTPERWNNFPHSQQILMIASELNRAKNWLKKRDYSEVKNCYKRALELLDLTIEISKKRTEVKELLRFREVLSDLYLQEMPTLDRNYKLYQILLLFNKDAFKQVMAP